MELQNAAVPLTRRRRYRRFYVVAAVLTGIAAGLFVGSFVAWAGDWRLLLLLLIPFGARLYGRAKGLVWSFDPALWLVPVVALAVASATYMLLPGDKAWAGAAVAAVMWFVLIFVFGVLEVVFDPDGTIAPTNGRDDGRVEGVDPKT